MELTGPRISFHPPISSPGSIPLSWEPSCCTWLSPTWGWVYTLPLPLSYCCDSCRGKGASAPSRTPPELPLLLSVTVLKKSSPRGTKSLFCLFAFICMRFEYYLKTQMAGKWLLLGSPMMPNFSAQAKFCKCKSEASAPNGCPDWHIPQQNTCVEYVYVPHVCMLGCSTRRVHTYTNEEADTVPFEACFLMAQEAPQAVPRSALTVRMLGSRAHHHCTAISQAPSLTRTMNLPWSGLKAPINKEL